MGGVRGRHWLGAVLGGVAAWLLILVTSSLYSVANGFGPLGPYEGSGQVLGFGYGSSTGLVVGLLVDFAIPLVVAFAFVVALAILSRRSIPALEFVSRGAAALDGALTGLVVWAVLYAPVIYSISHPAPVAYAHSLGFGLFDHLAFGAVIGLVVYQVGGPVSFGRERPATPGH